MNGVRRDWLPEHLCRDIETPNSAMRMYVEARKVNPAWSRSPYHSRHGQHQCTGSEVTNAISSIGRSSTSHASNPASQIAALQKTVAGLMKQSSGLQKALVGMGEGDAKEALKKQLEAIAQQIAVLQQQISALQSQGAQQKAIAESEHAARKGPTARASLRIADLSGGTVSTKV